MSIRTIAGLSLIALSAGASAASLPSFTFDPSAVLGTGSSFTADSVQLSDYATVLNSGPFFVESGYMAVTSFQFNGQPVTAPGLNTGGYGLYVKFSGAGLFGNPLLGMFSSVTYSLYGYTGAPAQFGFDGSHNAIKVTPTTDTLLASGSLVSGTGYVALTPAPLSAFAAMTLNFGVHPSSAAFFASPPAFYALAQATFSNTPQQITAFAGGYELNQGGGVMVFAVPEPQTYALMLAGLGVIGFLARRRQSN